MNLEDYEITSPIIAPHEVSKYRIKNPLFKEVSQVKLPERYIINKDATILFWENGKKTIVKRCEEDEFNPRLAFLTAFFQHYCGMSKNKANKYLASLEVGKGKYIKTKLKIGDKVIVRKDLIVGHDYEGEIFVPFMEKFRGKTVIISEVIEDDNVKKYHIETDGKKWFFTSEMFERKVEKNTKEEKTNGKN